MDIFQQLVIIILLATNVIQILKSFKRETTAGEKLLWNRRWCLIFKDSRDYLSFHTLSYFFVKLISFLEVTFFLKLLKIHVLLIASSNFKTHFPRTCYPSRVIGYDCRSRGELLLKRIFNSVMIVLDACEGFQNILQIKCRRLEKSQSSCKSYFLLWHSLFSYVFII